MKTSLLHVSDLHGSNVCFATLIKIAKARRPRFIAISGDITGKSITPIIPEGNDRWVAESAGRQQRLRGSRALADFETDVANAGSYPVQMSHEEVDRLRLDQHTLVQRLDEQKKRRLYSWLDLACRELPHNVTLLMIGGNDDPWSVDAMFKDHTLIVNPDVAGQTEIDGYRFFGESRANRTPWDCPRDCDDFDLEESINRKIAGIRDFGRSIFIFHSPPYESGLDLAPKLKQDGSPVTHGGEALMTPVGSSAVRRAIERCQPLLGLHGHVHESPCIRRLGRTYCSNPGSEYHRGFLRAAWFTLEGDAVSEYSLETIA